jgi:hypothetical protein
MGGKKNATEKFLLGFKVECLFISLHSALLILATPFLPRSLSITSPFKPSIKLYIYHSDDTVSHVEVPRETTWKLWGNYKTQTTNKHNVYYKPCSITYLHINCLKVSLKCEHAHRTQRLFTEQW